MSSSSWGFFNNVENFVLLSEEEEGVGHVIDTQGPGHSVGEVHHPDWGLVLEGVIFFGIEIVTHHFVDQNLEVSAILTLECPAYRLKRENAGLNDARIA